MTNPRVQAYRAALLERAGFGICRAAIEGRFLDVNGALVNMLGYDSPTELLSTNMRDVYADPVERDRLVHVHHRRDWFEGVEVTWRRKDGQPVKVRLAGRILSNSGPELLEAMVEDVTRQRQWESATRDAERLRAIGQLAGGMAHEYNNLLAVIFGQSELLLDALPPSSPACESVQEIQTASGKAAALTRQLLAFARRQPLKPKAFDVLELLERLRPIIQSSMRPGVVVEMPVAGRTAIVEVDASQLEQVILSLTANASDAMPTGGRLTIGVEDVELSSGAFGRGIEVTAGPFVLLTIEDTGEGMDDETKSRIFEPFFSTKPFGKGTGLGLAVVYGIMKQSRGFIFVGSEVGRGTRFRLYLPSAKPAHARDTVNSGRRAAPQHVLVVENQDGIRRFIATILRQQGYAVREASKGSDALAIAREENIALLITDANMPGMEGFALARRMRDECPDVRVLVLSGHVAEAGSLSFLPKPFSRPELLRRVAELLNDRPL